jgi:hypothetical protein
MSVGVNNSSRNHVAAEIRPAAKKIARAFRSIDTTFVIQSIAVYTLTASASYADILKVPLLECEMDSKELSLSLIGDGLNYQFGTHDHTELYLTQKLRTAQYEPWDGFGRYMGDSVIFQNGQYSYDVYTSYDNFQEEVGWTAGVNVFKKGNLLTRLHCNKPFQDNPLDRLFTAKEKSGQCWDLESQSWLDACQHSSSGE